MTSPDPPASASRRPSPVRLSAEVDPGLSRWLWLVKWLLAIPHFIVLWFLWIGFFFSSLGAFFAILVTGRFPRTLFDFNVGVMRWSWRVTYYSYGALGTDRYPPFTLGDVADYPARLDVAYPERLSRGLVLVKWWLLALPHYLVIAFFVGGGPVAASQDTDGAPAFLLGGGLIGLLVLFAAITLLFTGRYPRGIFDLLVGLQRWLLRVGAYAALMTDEYPPFRLDQGASVDDPGPGSGPDPRRAAVAPPVQGSRPASSTGRAAVIITGIIALVVGVAMLLAALALWAVRTALSDDDGFFTAPVVSCRVDSYALISEPIRLDFSGAREISPHSLLGNGKVTATSRDGSPLFVGIADTRLVEMYLGGTGRSTVLLESADDEAQPVCQTVTGEAPSALPTSLSIWKTYATGSGSQTITWPLREGNWTVVVMNLDGSEGVDVAVDAGATFPVIDLFVRVTLVAGGVFLLIGLGLLAAPVVLRSMRRPSSPADDPPG